MNGTEPVGPGKRESQTPRAGVDYERPLGGLLRDLSRDALRLVRKELDLARMEISPKVTNVWKNSKYLTIGAFVAYAGFLFIMAAAVVELSKVISISLSALLVGVLVMAAGLVLMRIGRKRIREEGLAPSKTLETLEGKREWIS